MDKKMENEMEAGMILLSLPDSPINWVAVKELKLKVPITGAHNM